MQHARVAVYTITSGTFKELAKDAEEGMLPIFERHPGFLHYGLQEAGHHVVSISIWETKAEAEAANVLAADWVRDHLAKNVRLETTYVGDLAFWRGARD
jgi:heme-degrading monooxygenase HmoA